MSIQDFEAILESLPERGWARIDTNSHFDTFPSEGVRPHSDSNITNVWSAWAGFAYIKPARVAMIYGGGHANTSYNGLFHFSLHDLKWHRTCLPTRTWTPANEGFDGWRDAARAIHDFDWQSHPLSAHCYQTNVYLPAIDRFATLGGAVAGLGGPYKRYDETSDDLGNEGPYIFNYHTADPDKLAAKTGYQYKEDEVRDPNLHPGEIEGTESWAVPVGLGATSGPNGMADVRVENGEDVIYWGRASCIRTVIKPVLSESHSEVVGRAWVGTSSKGDAALFDHLNLYVCTGRSNSEGNLILWDLDNASPTNNDVEFTPDPSLGFPGVEDGLPEGWIRRCGHRYDPVRKRSVIMDRQGRVWTLNPPPDKSGDITEGWWTERVTISTANSPEETGQFSDRQVHGMWQYMPEFDAFLHMSATGGEVWVWKPDNWQGKGPADTTRVWSESVSAAGARLWRPAVEPDET